MKRGIFPKALVASIALLAAIDASAANRFVQIEARTREERTRIANLGVSIEAVRSDSVWGLVPETLRDQLKREGIRILGDFDEKVARGGHESGFDFPGPDSRFHNYSELTTALQGLATRNSDIARVHSIGKTIEGRDMWAININTTPADLAKGSSGKPGMIYMGNHHAREHLSLEVPLMFAEYLLNNRNDKLVGKLIESRDIWIVPMVNPDGAEYDIATGKYRSWRKNRRKNADGTWGVDLNRNYSYQWGTGGSSNDGSSEVFMGPRPFSEPETQAIRDFIEAHLNAKVLLTFHTYSELVLYPWGHTYDPVENNRDHQVFETMAKTMAGWNKYTPEQTSELYIASGDTTDWAYGTHGIFAFTFELSPASPWDGGFYPGAKVIDKVFQDNLKPCLYLLEFADDPYRVLGPKPSSYGLRNYVEPQAPMWWQKL